MLNNFWKITFGLLLLINTILLVIISLGRISSEKEFAVKEEKLKITDYHFRGKAPLAADTAVDKWDVFRKQFPHLVDSINQVEDSINVILDSISNIDISKISLIQQQRTNDLYNVLSGVNRKLDQVIDLGKLALLKNDAANIKLTLTLIDKQVASLKKVADITDKITGYLQIVLQALDALTGSGLIKPASVSSVKMSL